MKEPWLPIEQEIGWAPQSVWTCRGRENLFASAGSRILDLSASNLVGILSLFSRRFRAFVTFASTVEGPVAASEQAHCNRKSRKLVWTKDEFAVCYIVMVNTCTETFEIL